MRTLNVSLQSNQEQSRMIQDIFSIRGSQFGNFSFFFARPKSFRKKPARRREIFTWDAYHAYHGKIPVEFFFIFSDIKTMLFSSGKRNNPAKDNCSSELFRRPLFIASSFSVDSSCFHQVSFL